MPGIEKAAGSAANAIAIQFPEPITTQSLVASVKGEPPPAAAKAPPDPQTQEIVKTVKGHEAERELAKHRRMIDAQKKDGQSAKDVGMCKTLVSGSAVVVTTIVTGLVTKNPYAAAASGAAGKALGDGVAWQLCDPEAAK